LERFWRPGRGFAKASVSVPMLEKELDEFNSIEAVVPGLTQKT
jgi:hypothetical protein